MGHKGNASFFAKKQDWSRRKDTVLGYYLTPYLPKVATQRRPIVVVDGFAGPGEFDDGEPGSPLIICRAVEIARRGGLRVPVSVYLVESDPDLAERLQRRCASFASTTVRTGRFLEHVEEILGFAKSSSVFLYLDPYAIEGLEWEPLKRIFDNLAAGRSIEILLNLNVVAFVRRALAALSLSESFPSSDDADADDLSAETNPSAEALDAVAGGTWWRKIVESQSDFPSMVRHVTEGFRSKLSGHFREVCFHEVKARVRHKIPKYVLGFGSRHPDALLLMNEAMIKSRQQLAATEAPVDPTLFEVRSEELIPDPGKLPDCIERAMSGRMSRGQLVAAVVRSNFCQFSESEIKKCIGTLLKNGRLTSSTGKTRINDDVEIWRSTA